MCVCVSVCPLGVGERGSLYNFNVFIKIYRRSGMHMKGLQTQCLAKKLSREYLELDKNVYPRPKAPGNIV